MIWGDVLQHAYIIRRIPNNFKQMLIDEWALLPQEMFHQLVLSMRRRCEATIASSDLVRGTTPKGGVDGWASRAAHVMGDAIPNVLPPGDFV
ncbi:hypothetical protein TNCV_140071 [Trichonephila clavipes]|uniref:Uncharacterized protein n=1 Tax=Trichonephila clavipes TaxID=2585209 RepID=A0A8X6V3C1_TRICX|nr:hypothetical protein TNCV_140071 [Trichonephila clavipes]